MCIVEIRMQKKKWEGGVEWEDPGLRLFKTREGRDDKQTSKFRIKCLVI